MKKLIALTAVLSTLAFGAAPSGSSPLTVTTTSAAYYVPFGYIELICTSPTYYSMETTSSGAALTTDALHPGALVVNGVSLPRSRWINVSAGTQYLALLLKAGVQGSCLVSQYSVDGVAGSFSTLAASGAATLSSTLAVTGATTLSSTLAVTGASTLTGNVSAGGTLAVTGASTLTGNVSAGGTLAVTGASTLTGNVSAGGTLAVTGTSTLTGAQTLTGATAIGTSLTLPSSTAMTGFNFGSITLNGASPATGTATVLAGVKCTCTPETNASDGLLKCAVSSTTLTATGPNSSTGVVNYMCFK